MNAWPHGVIVVPTVPTTASRYAAVTCPCGATRSLRALAPVRMGEDRRDYVATETPAPIARKTYWMRRKPARASSNVTTAPCDGSGHGRERSGADANSASVVRIRDQHRPDRERRPADPEVLADQPSTT